MKSFTTESIQKNMDRLAKCFPHLTKSPHTHTAKIYGKKYAANILQAIASRYDQLAYPQHPNWSYCIPIIPAFEHKGKIVDIGLHLDDDWLIGTHCKTAIISGLSSNIVYSNDGPDYGSGGPGICSVYDKQLMLALYKLEIISRQDLLNQFDFNNLLMKFYNSDLTGFDLQNLIK
jgi:hypothetical protein